MDASGNKKTFESRATRIELNFLEALRERLPTHRALLEAALELHTMLGHYPQALQTAQALAAIAPEDPVTWYALGACYTLNHRETEALAALTRAIKLGFHNYEWIMSDKMLLPLRAHPLFKKLIRQVSHPASSSQAV